MVIKFSTFSLKHAGSFEIPGPSLCPLMLWRFNSYEMPLKIFVDFGFGGVIHPNPNEVVMMVNHDP